MNIQYYHKHTSLSHRYNKDSPLVPMDYFKELGKLGHQGIPTIYSTVEHGWQGNYFHIYDDLEKFNAKQLKENENYVPIKFVFGAEAYWVKNRFEKDSSNCHIVLLAKNDNGRKKLNRAIYESFNSGYYYKNRMDLDILLSLPKDDIFVTSACVSFGWNTYDDIEDIVVKLNNHFTDFYLEVQANDTQLQKEVNKKILELHYKYDIPLICGTDTHVINMEQMEDREDLLKSNGINYPDEDGNYMDLPTVDTLIQRFKEQGILNDDEIRESIENTNVILDFEDIVLDRSLKVPTPLKYKQYNQEERNKIFKSIITKEWNNQIEDIDRTRLDEYKKEIQYNTEEIIGCNMTDYFLMNYETMILGQEKYGGILTPSGRGSGVSFYLNKLLRFTKVDKINSDVKMYAERFLTKERIIESKTPPDIDHNVSDREPFKLAQEEVLGTTSFDLLALGTLHYKSAFKMYARAYKLDPQLANEVTKEIDKYEVAMKHKEEDDEIDIFDFVNKEKYGELIEGCKQYMGIVDTVKSHPCGTIAYMGDTIEDVGVIMVKSESTGRECFVALQESSTIDSFGYLKQDYLIVDSIGLTYDIYKEIGIEPFTVNQLLKEIENDKPTWDVYSKGLTMCINQVEQQKSTEKVMRFKPQNISELCQFVAGIRPSFQTMYKTFESRTHFDYGIKAFDDVIQDEFMTSSFLLYQETLMKVLGFAGFPMKDTYTIIKAISKKKSYIIKEAKEKFIPNFTSKILEVDNISKEKALEYSQKVWKIIEDSASYGFNASHSYCMAIDSVTLAWQKAHYPLEFYKVCLQRYTDKGNKDKVSNLKKEMLKQGIKLNPIRFGADNRQFTIDKENNAINQTMSSIKNMQKIVPQIMYNIGLQTTNLFMIFKKMKDNGINKKSLDILIKLNYFSDYGDVNYVQKQFKVYEKSYEIINKIKTAKQLSKEFCSTYNLDLNEIKSCCEKETAKLFKDFDEQKITRYINKNTQSIVNYVDSQIEYKPTQEIDLVKYDLQILGFTDKTIEDCEYYGVANIEENKYGSVFISLYNISNGSIETFKVKKAWFNEYPIEQGDIIDAIIKEQYRKKLVDKKWIDNTEVPKESVLVMYSKVC